MSAYLFPPESLGFLNALSQIGLLVFMFLVGLELDPKLLKDRGHAAVVTSHASIIVPFLLGSALCLYLYPQLSDDSVNFTHFALFMGVAMSVTAFPVLARILTERKLLQTKVGAVTITCAAVDDVTAWCILAGVVLLVRAGEATIPFWLTLIGSGAFAAFMLFAARPLLRRLNDHFRAHGTLTQSLLAVVLLLPLYFAFTGLRTSIGLISGAEWSFCALIILVAILGKFGGSTLAARATGMSWREASALGVLMNTRGLVELVILNVGLDIGVLSPTLFAMMVLMALVTTFMTSPLLELIYPARLIRQETSPTAGTRAAQ